MDEDRGIQAVVDIYVQSGQLSKAEADLAVASSLTVVGAREQLNAAVREKMNADSIGGIQAAADSFVQSGKLSKGQADLAVASSLTVAAVFAATAARHRSVATRAGIRPSPARGSPRIPSRTGRPPPRSRRERSAEPRVPTSPIRSHPEPPAAGR